MYIGVFHLKAYVIIIAHRFSSLVLVPGRNFTPPQSSRNGVVRSGARGWMDAFHLALAMGSVGQQSGEDSKATEAARIPAGSGPVLAAEQHAQYRNHAGIHIEH